MGVLLEAVVLALQVVGVFLASTLAFDVVHWLLHRMAGSRSALLRAVAGLHEVHHRFLGRDLRIHPEYLHRNLLCHVIPEFLTQAGFSLCLLWVLPARVVVGALALQLLVFALILRARGMDVNHRGWEKLRAHRPHVFCLPAYHALHHVHPDAHFSSWIKLFDLVLGSGTSFAGRRVVLDGADTRLAAALGRRLAGLGVAAVEALPEATTADAREAALRGADVLVLTPRSRGEGSAAQIERFLELARERRFPPEVWCLAGEGTDAPARYFFDPRVIYRRVVLSADPAADAAAADRVAGRALSAIRRGLHYVPGAFGWRELRDFLRFRRAARVAA